MLEKVSHVILLKDFYGPLLTPKQQDIMQMYYENDLSLSEIADDQHVTRQAVYDIIKRAEKTLEEYENKLGLVAKFTDTRQKMQDVYMLLNIDKPDNVSISRAVEILKEITELV